MSYKLVGAGTISKGVETLLTLLTLGAALLFVGVAAKSFFTRTPSVDMPTLGANVAIDNVDWSKNRKTLVVAMQPDCAYCDASIPFYRDILASIQDSAVHPLVVFPHAKEAGARELQRMGLAIGDVRQADFRKLRVPGTPTVMLVDEGGRVTNVWVGKLSAGVEDIVFERMGLKRRARTSQTAADAIGPNGISEREFARSLTDLAVLDTRPRATFKKAHLAGARNIPMDELEARVLHEVSKQQRTVLFCDRPPTCPIVFQTPGLRTECDMSLDYLRSIGFADVKVLAGTIDGLEQSGITVVRTQG